MYGINLATNLLRLAKPLTEAEQQQVVTEIPEPMQQVLTSAEETEVPVDRKQAMEVLEKHISKVRSYVLSDDVLRRCEHDVASLKGTADPRYYKSCGLISHHDYGVEQLRKMGLM